MNSKVRDIFFEGETKPDFRATKPTHNFACAFSLDFSKAYSNAAKFMDTEWSVFDAIDEPRPFREGLEFVDASYRSVQGRIGSRWTVLGGSLAWDIEIPANTTAEVHLPVREKELVSESALPIGKSEGILSVRESGDELILEIGSGRYHFQIKNSSEQ